MRKFKTGLMALAMLIGAGAAFATTHHSKKHHKDADLNWYHADQATGKITSGVLYTEAKEDVIAENDQPCDDTSSTLCFFGSPSSSLTVGSSYGTTDSSNTINQAAQ